MSGVFNAWTEAPWQWPDVGSSTSITTTWVDLNESEHEQQGFQMEAFNSLSLPGPREIDYSNQTFATSTENAEAKLKRTQYWYTPAKGDYRHNCNWQFSLDLPVTMQTYFGMPATISVYWSLSTDADPKGPGGAGEVIFTVDVGQVLASAIGGFRHMWYSPDGTITHMIYRATGLLKHQLGKIYVSVSYVDNYEQMTSNHTVHNQHTIVYDVSASDMQLIPVPPAGEESASD